MRYRIDNANTVAKPIVNSDVVCSNVILVLFYFKILGFTVCTQKRDRGDMNGDNKL